MSATGFTHEEHELNHFQRVYKLFRLPDSPTEYFMSVDHHPIWRRHLAWSSRDGQHLINVVTARFASNMVFMSLLLGTEIGVLFSPSEPADKFRAALQTESYGDLNFWAAIILCISIGLTLSTLVANFTAWAIIGAVSPQNSHAILRSSLGLDAAQLPARLVIISIYCFVIWMMVSLCILIEIDFCFSFIHSSFTIDTVIHIYTPSEHMGLRYCVISCGAHCIYSHTIQLFWEAGHLLESHATKGNIQERRGE
jgi:hypothetical protein